MVGFLEIEETAENYAGCMAYTRHYAKSFYFASHVLPKQKRMAAYAVYAFCRYADSIVDNAGAGSNTAIATNRLAALRDQLRYVYNYSPQMDHKLLAFRDVVFRYNIPQEYFLDLLRGVEMDLSRTSYRTFSELQEYCYCVASVVGLIMTRIFGVRDDQAFGHAADLGTAMQLTNILRDIGEDYRMGRRYVPLEDLERFGYSELELARGVVNKKFRELMAFEVGRARQYYVSAEQGIPMIVGNGSQKCVRLMSRTYGTILDEIESQEYDVFSHRAYVGSLKKLAIAATVLLNPGRTARSIERKVAGVHRDPRIASSPLVASTSTGQHPGLS